MPVSCQAVELLVSQGGEAAVATARKLILFVLENGAVGRLCLSSELCWDVCVVPGSGMPQP